MAESVTESARHEVFKWFEEAMGPERAAAMMGMLSPSGWADVASKHDLEHLRAVMEQRFDHLQGQMDSRFDRMQGQMDSRFDRMQGQMDSRFDLMEAHVRTSTAESMDRQTKVYVGWMLGGLGTMLGAMIGVMSLVA